MMFRRGFSQSPLPPSVDHLQTGSTSVGPTDFIHHRPSQLVPSINAHKPDDANPDRPTASPETPPTLGSVLRRNCSPEECPPQSSASESDREMGTLKSKERVVATPEFGVEAKIKTSAILEVDTIGQGGTLDPESQDGLSERITKAASTKECQELQLMAELREKAQRLKKNVLHRFSKGKKGNSNASRVNPGKRNIQKGKTEGQHKCSYPECTFTASRKVYVDKHISTHYPNSYFCPICLTTFSRESALKDHLSRSSGSGKKRKLNDEQRDQEIESCIESEEALRYEVARDTERFNLYYLGVMEDYEMDEEHFEALAKRQRKRPRKD